MYARRNRQREMRQDEDDFARRQHDSERTFHPPGHVQLTGHSKSPAYQRTAHGFDRALKRLAQRESNTPGIACHLWFSFPPRKRQADSHDSEGWELETKDLSAGYLPKSYDASLPVSQTGQPRTVPSVYGALAGSSAFPRRPNFSMR